MEDKKIENRYTYKGNSIPLFIKIAWSILVIWIIFYLLSYMTPNLAEWLKK